MNQHDHSSAQSNDEQQSQNVNNAHDQSDCTIDTCTMDPCPMKTESKDDQPVKCPACGKSHNA
jgi:hypothetical protein